MPAARRWILGLVAFVFLAGGAPGASARSWRSCGDGFGASCTRVVVPLDRSGVVPGTVGLRVARIPGPAHAAVLLYLSGGPGAGGLDELENVLWAVSSLTTSYRVVTFDQRGTGASGLLRCPSVERDVRLRSTRAGAACARRLGVTRRFYTTGDSVGDVEAVRRALGVDRLTLFGVSYGTELALAYARAYPQHVARMALDSIADPDDRDPFALAGFRAMGATLSSSCPSSCAGVTRDPVADLARLAARLRVAALRGRVVDLRGRASSRLLREVSLADLMYDADYDPALRAGIPSAVRAALAGDAAPLLRLVAVGDALGAAGGVAPSEFSSARYATVCEETPLPWDATTPLDDRLAVARGRAAALGPGAFFPFDFATAAADEIDLCLRWPGVPRATPPAAATATTATASSPAATVGSPPASTGSSPASTDPYPAVPTLILQGGEDLRTPPEVSARVAALLPDVTRIVVLGVGHATVTADPTGCAAGVLLRFLAGIPVGGDCPRVPTGVPAVQIPPRTLAAVQGASRRARTLAAVGLTLDDVRFALSPAFLTRAGGGLRGGHYLDSGRRGLVLTGYEAVGGVRVSGRWHASRLRLRVSGRAATPGHLTVTPAGRYSGTLAGHRVAGRFPHEPPHPSSRGGIATAGRGRVGG